MNHDVSPLSNQTWSLRQRQELTKDTEFANSYHTLCNLKMHKGNLKDEGQREDISLYDKN